MADLEWLDLGNGERGAVLEDPENVGNYKSLKVRPWPTGEWVWSVNGTDRGRAPTMKEAKALAVKFARAQIVGIE